MNSTENVVKEKEIPIELNELEKSIVYLDDMTGKLASALVPVRNIHDEVEAKPGGEVGPSLCDLAAKIRANRLYIALIGNRIRSLLDELEL